jgi:hypothetical protein
LAETPKSEIDKTFVIAIIMIVSYIVFFYLAWNFDTGKDNDFAGLKVVTATVGSLVAIIIGYYFGNKPVEDIRKNSELVRSLLSKEKSDSLEIIASDLDLLRKCTANGGQALSNDQLIAKDIPERIKELEQKLKDKMK